MSKGPDNERQRVKPEPANPRRAPNTPGVPPGHLESVRRSIRSMVEPLQKLNTHAFTPLTYVEDSVDPGGPAPPTPSPEHALGSPPRTDDVQSAPRTGVTDVFSVLFARVLSFQEGLNPDEEVALILPQLGAAHRLHLLRLIGLGAGMLSLQGHIDGDGPRCEWLVTASQLNLVMVPGEPPAGRRAARLTDPAEPS